MSTTSEVTAPPNAEAVASYRAARFRYDAAQHLRRLDQIVRWIDEQGLAVLFPQPPIPLPSLWEAVNGGPRALPHHTHHDPALGRLWRWKDAILSRGSLYYGKALRGHPGFIARRWLPAFYAAAGRLGDEDDHETAYADGHLSEDARRVCQAIVEHGPATTGLLRRESGLYGRGEPSRRFDRALAELQRGMFVVPVAVSDENAWKYCFVYDLLPRRFPDEVARASLISSREAAREVVRAYLEVVGADTVDGIARLLGQTSAWLLRELRTLADADEVAIFGNRGSAVVSLPRLAVETDA